MSISLDVDGSISVSISSSGLRIQGNATFLLNVGNGFSFNVSLKDFTISIGSFTDLALELGKYIISKFSSLVTEALRILVDIGKKIAKFFGNAVDGIVAVGKQIGNTVQQTIQWLAGKPADLAKNAMKKVYGITDAIWNQVKGFANWAANAAKSIWKKIKFWSELLAFSIRGLQLHSIMYFNVDDITDEVINNTVRNLLNIPIDAVAYNHYKSMFMFHTDSFSVNTDVTPEMDSSIFLLFENCEKLQCYSNSAIAKLIANKRNADMEIPDMEIHRNNLTLLVSLLPGYYLGLKQVVDVVLREWFMSEDVVLPPIFQSLNVGDTAETRTLQTLLSVNIMTPLIRHLDLFFSLLQYVHAVFGLSPSLITFNEALLQMTYLSAAQLLVATHYNTALSYPDLHANGTLVKFNGVNHVILDSRLHFVGDLSFFKPPTKEVSFLITPVTDPLLFALAHSPTIQMGSSLESSNLYRIRNEGADTDGSPIEQIIYVLEIQGHLRVISDELLHIFTDKSKLNAPFIDEENYAPGLPLYKHTSFLQGFAVEFDFTKEIIVEDDGYHYKDSKVNYEYGSMDLNSFLYPVIITIAETGDMIFRLTSEVIFRIDAVDQFENVAASVTKLYQECHILGETEIPFHITLSLSQLPRVFSQDIKNLLAQLEPKEEKSCHDYGYSNSVAYSDTSDEIPVLVVITAEDISKLPIFNANSGFRLMYYSSASLPEDRYKIIFGGDNYYYYTSFLPLSLMKEDIVLEFKKNAIHSEETQTVGISPVVLIITGDNIPDNQIDGTIPEDDVVPPPYFNYAEFSTIVVKADNVQPSWVITPTTIQAKHEGNIEGNEQYDIVEIDTGFINIRNQKQNEDVSISANALTFTKNTLTTQLDYEKLNMIDDFFEDNLIEYVEDDAILTGSLQVSNSITTSKAMITDITSDKIATATLESESIVTTSLTTTSSIRLSTNILLNNVTIDGTRVAIENGDDVIELSDGLIKITDSTGKSTVSKKKIDEWNTIQYRDPENVSIYDVGRYIPQTTITSIDPWKQQQFSPYGSNPNMLFNSLVVVDQPYKPFIFYINSVSTSDLTKKALWTEITNEQYFFFVVKNHNSKYSASESGKFLIPHFVPTLARPHSFDVTQNLHQNDSKDFDMVVKYCTYNVDHDMFVYMLDIKKSIGANSSILNSSILIEMKSLVLSCAATNAHFNQVNGANEYDDYYMNPPSISL